MAEYDPFSHGWSTNMNGSVPSYPQEQQPDYDDSEEDDYDPSNLQFTVAQEAQSPALPDQPTPEQEAETEPEVESRTETPIVPTATLDPPPTVKPATPASPVAQAPAKQPRTVGGFVVDDEDDEDDAPVTAPAMAGSNGMLNVAEDSPSTQQRSVTQTPSNTLPPPDTSIDKAAQDQGSSGVADSIPNGAAVSSSSGVAPSPAPSLPISTGVQAPVQSVPTSNVSLPKARLPQDRVGILEDRIAEDPRGDIDAWLSLISEHKQRNKISEIRATYNRFFEVFPTAVNLTPTIIPLSMRLTEFRLSNGWRMPTWSCSTTILLPLSKYSARLF